MPASIMIAVLAALVAERFLEIVIPPVAVSISILRAAMPFEVDPKVSALESVTLRAPTVPELDKTAILLDVFDSVRLPAPATTKPKPPSLTIFVSAKESPLGVLIVATPVRVSALEILKLLAPACKVVPAAIETAALPKAELLPITNVPLETTVPPP